MGSAGTRLDTLFPKEILRRRGGGVSRGVYRSADDAFVDGMALGDGRAI